jgi:hypothetical protein
VSEERPGWHRHPNGGGWVQDTTRVADTAYVGPDATVYSQAKVYDSAWVFESARVFGSAWVFNSARVFDSAWVSGLARVVESAEVYGQARVDGSAEVDGSAAAFGSAEVFDPRHVLSLSPLGQQGLNLWRTADGHQLAAGCTLTTVPDAREALTLARCRDLWPDVSETARRQWRAQWLAALDLCALRVEEWEAGR